MEVKGKDGTGRKTVIPWVRIYSESRSPHPTAGWYVVYLFSGLGGAVYLSLNQGTMVWHRAEGGSGYYLEQPHDNLVARSDWARAVIAPSLALRADLHAKIDLESRGRDFAAPYSAGNVTAIRYPVDDLPDEALTDADLRFMLGLLGAVYEASELGAPGETPPEVVDAEEEAVERSSPLRAHLPFRLSHAERVAIERRAVDVAADALEADGWSVHDVGSVKPHDLEARRGDAELWVEVKGTTSAGDEVILTRGEVLDYGGKYPDTMLAIVTSIALDRSADPPVASGGTLRTIRPWRIDPEDLTAVSYRYSVPASSRST
jgi:MrcB-like, N-terminal domain/Domain of unknown function (DUF3883)